MSFKLFIKKVFSKRKPKHVPDIVYLRDVLRYLASLEVSLIEDDAAMAEAFWRFNWYRSANYCYHPMDSKMLAAAFLDCKSPAAFLRNFNAAIWAEIHRPSDYI